MPATPTGDREKAAAASSSSTLRDRRFKLSRACDRCRRRRIKCDEGHPCQACLAVNSACTFEEPGKRAPHPQKSKRTTSLEDRMQQLEMLIKAIQPAVIAVDAPGLVHPQSSSLSAQTVAQEPFVPLKSSPYPSGVPPPSMNTFPLAGPSAYFFSAPSTHTGANGALPEAHDHYQSEVGGTNGAVTPTPRSSSLASYFYFDNEGFTRWQGETSGLPLLDLLIERHAPFAKASSSSLGGDQDEGRDEDWREGSSQAKLWAGVDATWIPNQGRGKQKEYNPEATWRLVTAQIPSDLMDTLVHCFLSTSYYILPFIHVPSFLADYGNPIKWGEPGFAALIVSICCLASRHIDDPRVRAEPENGLTSGIQYFVLLNRLLFLAPSSYLPTLYMIQATLVGAVYAVGLGKLSPASSLLSTAITLSIDAGLHRSADSYEVFDPLEEEVRKRTFWCVYIWDKKLAAHFGRPVMLKMGQGDVGEPCEVDDEFISREGINMSPEMAVEGASVGDDSRMSAFNCVLRIASVLELVLDASHTRLRPSPPSTSGKDTSNSFLSKVAALKVPPPSHKKPLEDEETLLGEILASIPPRWAHTPETLSSNDVIRFTQAVRLHCAGHFVRLMIFRYRFSELFAERTGNERNWSVGGERRVIRDSGPVNDEQDLQEEVSEAEIQAMVSAHGSALEIVGAHLGIASKGLMTYFGVHVIHQLTQAGRTLVAILLNCQSECLRELIPSGLDALRSCVGLLRKFSGKYVCGQRSGDLMEEFCRLTKIPLKPNLCPESVTLTTPTNTPSASPVVSCPTWIRPVKKRGKEKEKEKKDLVGDRFLDPEDVTRAWSNGSGSACSLESPEGLSPMGDFYSSADAIVPPVASVPIPLSTSSSSGLGENERQRSMVEEEGSRAIGLSVESQSPFLLGEDQQGLHRRHQHHRQGYQQHAQDHSYQMPQQPMFIAPSNMLSLFDNGPMEMGAMFPNGWGALQVGNVNEGVDMGLTSVLETGIGLPGGPGMSSGPYKDYGPLFLEKDGDVSAFCQ